MWKIKRIWTKPPSYTPPYNMQYNFTDQESGIMKTGIQKNLRRIQCTICYWWKSFNIIQLCNSSCNDKLLLIPCVESIDLWIRYLTYVLGDKGYYSQKTVESVVSNEEGLTDLCGKQKTGIIEQSKF